VKKNDPPGHIVQPDGTLLVTKDLSERPVQRGKTFDVTRGADPRLLFRLLIAAYIAGYTTMVVFPRDRLPTAIRMAAREFSQIGR